MGACRQSRNESLPIYYSRNHFFHRFNMTSHDIDQASLISYIARMGRHRITMLAHLEIGFLFNAKPCDDALLAWANVFTIPFLFRSKWEAIKIRHKVRGTEQTKLRQAHTDLDHLVKKVEAFGRKDKRHRTMREFRCLSARIERWRERLKREL